MKQKASSLIAPVVMAAASLLYSQNAKAQEDIIPLTVNAKAGYHQAGADSNKTPEAKAFFQYNISDNLNPSLELIAAKNSDASETDFGVGFGNRHGSEDGHIGYAVLYEKEGDFSDISLLLEAHADKLFKGGTDIYLRTHMITGTEETGDLANGADVGVIARLLDTKKGMWGLNAEVAAHLYDTERIDEGINTFSVGLEGEAYITKRSKLSAGVRYIGDEKLVGDNVLANVAFSVSLGSENALRSSFYDMPFDRGLDMQHIDANKNHKPVDIVSSDGTIDKIFLEPEDYDEEVSNGNIKESDKGTPTVTLKPGDSYTYTGDTVVIDTVNDGHGDFSGTRDSDRDPSETEGQGQAEGPDEEDQGELPVHGDPDEVL